MSAEPAPARRPRAHWIVWMFALIGVGGILALVALVTMIAGAFDRHQPAKVAGKTAEESFTVGSVQRLHGTDLLHMEISTSEARGGSLSSGRGSDVRNILLVDRRSGAHRRILPDNRRRIRSSRFFSATGEGAFDSERVLAEETETREAPAAYYLLEVENARNGRIVDLLLGRLADGGQAVVMKGIDGVDSVWVDGPGRLGLIVRERLGLYYRMVDMGSLKTVENRSIAID